MGFRAECLQGGSSPPDPLSIADSSLPRRPTAASLPRCPVLASWDWRYRPRWRHLPATRPTNPEWRQPAWAQALPKAVFDSDIARSCPFSALVERPFVEE